MKRALLGIVLVLLAATAVAAPREQTLAGWSVEGLTEPKARMEQLRASTRRTSCATLPPARAARS